MTPVTHSSVYLTSAYIYVWYYFISAKVMNPICPQVYCYHGHFTMVVASYHSIYCAHLIYRWNFIPSKLSTTGRVFQPTKEHIPHHTVTHVKCKMLVPYFTPIGTLCVMWSVAFRPPLFPDNFPSTHFWLARPGSQVNSIKCSPLGYLWVKDSKCSS